MSIKLLVLVTKGLNDEYVATLMTDVRDALQHVGISNVTLVDSGAWFRERFSQTGDWDSWIWETVNGIDYITRQYNFDGFVATTEQLGRANASILSLALRNKRAVLSYLENRSIRKILDINADDPDNWAEGWSFDSVEIGV